MYLYYYLNEKYVGTVDLEVFFASKAVKTLVTCSQDCEDLMSSWELMYGKRIERGTCEEVYDITHQSNGKLHLAKHVYTTKKCGPVLQWNDNTRALHCPR